ncbi:MAG: DUF1801 domain-containing protein [Pseudomonadota bacterium]
MPCKDRYEEIKHLIAQAAAEVPGIGAIDETIKWGQPSFAPAKQGIGSSVRIETRPDGEFGLMFICTTGLVDEFRSIYGDTLHFEANRAIVLKDGPLAEQDALKHCIQLALTHKLRRKTRS